MNVIIGYVRVSTVDQPASYEAQKEALLKAGAEKIFDEKVSAVAKVRPKLEEALGFVREGDVLKVCALDRLARSVADLVEIHARLEAKHVGLVVLNAAMDTTTAVGKLMLNVLGSIAEFERSLILERQRVGIAAAHAAGKYKGRAPTAQKKAAEILELRAQRLSIRAIAKQLGIGHGSVGRILQASGQADEVAEPERSVLPSPACR